MKTIFKYNRFNSIHSDTNSLSFEIPLCANLVCLELQGIEPTFWFEVDSAEKKKELRVFTWFFTGVEIPYSTKYCKTFIREDDGIVYHIYEILK